MIRSNRMPANNSGSFAQIASIAVGYNNPALNKAAQSPAMVRALVNRPALGSFPSVEWLEQLEQGVLKAAPKGFNQVFTTAHGSDANETAFKAAFMYRAQLDRGGPEKPFTEEDIASTRSPDHPIILFSHLRAVFTHDFSVPFLLLVAKLSTSSIFPLSTGHAHHSLSSGTPSMSTRLRMVPRRRAASTPLSIPSPPTTTLSQL